MANELKTCYNCINYMSTISNYNDLDDHYHGFCRVWKKILDTMVYYKELDVFDYEHSKNIKLKEQWIYDDLETGRACCYMFEKGKDWVDDSWMLKNRKKNDELLEEVRKENGWYDE